MVHVDSVPRGLKCKCICPYCQEQLLARHGDIREHGFAHHSNTRQATLNICYMVVLYKLAEQLIQEKKRIRTPSYYGIYKGTDIEFIDVKIDSRFERMDKQPDVIATANDGSQYLIEFLFKYKVQHKQPIDYNQLTCLEINLSNQTLESLESFLFSSDEDRRWVNNVIYFNQIETTYRNAGRPVKIVSKSDCSLCEIKHLCCAIKNLYIENNGQTYRLCKSKTYTETLNELKEQEQQIKEKNIEHQEEQQNKSKSRENNINDKFEISCLNCEFNLQWANKDNIAVCGCYSSFNISKYNNPDYAVNCSHFKNKNIL